METPLKNRLIKVHGLFLDSVKDYVRGEVLVGTSVYAKEKNLSESTDLDIICIVDEEKLQDFLNSKYLKDMINLQTVLKIMKEGLSDYLVLKTKLGGVLLSIDVIFPAFFKKMCNIKLIWAKKDYPSYKFGNLPQTNRHPSFDFLGRMYMIQKRNTKIDCGYIIELPLFFIKEGRYCYGIPTVKYLTSKIFLDADNFLLNNIKNLKREIVKRMLMEFPNKGRETYGQYYLNLLIKKDKFPNEYKQKILKEMNRIINMEDKIRAIKKEIYTLFRKDTGEKRYSYVRRDWIFPNHLDIMLQLVEEMCSKYKGDEEICKIAVLLHDVGLVYKRDSPSPGGHESRSMEYAKIILEKYEMSQEMQEEIINCVGATDASENPTSLNPKIVRTADALSQFISVHFFAKAAFSGDWESYKGWLTKKATNNFKKICFEDEIKRAKPIRDYILSAIELYEKNRVDYPKEMNRIKEGEGDKDEPPTNN